MSLFPKFSVITICYNHAEFIEKTIISVLEQGYSNFEHIIVDGGSTDSTLSILKRYPHLKWTSEKDRGVSHALNKGLSQATGDIIAWINSDDFYLPETFQTVAKEIEGKQILLGDAIESDRAGAPVQTVTNNPRSYFDILRYWVPKAWFAQPSVFFTREALESVRLSNGDYINETFKYSMDYDLWLRLAKKYPFNNYVPKALSSFRVYGENLTGRAFASPQRELGRAFRAAVARNLEPERMHTFIIPAMKVDQQIAGTIQSLFDQKLQGFDVIIVDCSQSAEEHKLLKQLVESLEESTTFMTFRLLNATGSTFSEAIAKGIAIATSPTITVLEAGNLLPANAHLDIANTFAHDPYGVCIHVSATSPEGGKIIQENSQVTKLNSLLECESEFLPFTFRKVIADEIGNYPSQHILPFQSFMMKASFHGWMVIIDETPEAMVRPESLTQFKPRSVIFKQFQWAFLLNELVADMNADPFHPIRSESAYSAPIPAEASQYAKMLLTSAPPQWWTM